MTEEEAKTKWCPFVRAPHLGTAGINRQIDDQPTPQARCIGSACMAWQWLYEENRQRMAVGVESVGFCGLASKP